MATTQSTIPATTVRSGSIITSCNRFDSSETTCSQGPCAKYPCTMQCGILSAYESCQQHCDRSICDAIDCTASGACNQTCEGGRCGPMSCNAPNCFQNCDYGICDTMSCPRNTVRCVQSAAAKDLICEAGSCDQSCSRGFCNATCLSAVKTCNQRSYFGLNNMTCAPGVETCTQTSTMGFGIMRCDADVCKQNCSGFQCDMFCSSSVKECHQSCGRRARCRLSCEAESCKPDCPAEGVQCTILNIANKNSAPGKAKNSFITSPFRLSVGCFISLQSFIFTFAY